MDGCLLDWIFNSNMLNQQFKSWAKIKEKWHIILLHQDMAVSSRQFEQDTLHHFKISGVEKYTSERVCFLKIIEKQRKFQIVFPDGVFRKQVLAYHCIDSEAYQYFQLLMTR